jgi:hypothetical protein
MHNRALHDTLAAFVEEAAWQLAEEVSGGAEVPFELINTAPTARGKAPFYCYRPLTQRFLAERAGALGRLPSYVPAIQGLMGLPDLPGYLRARCRRLPGPEPRMHADAALQEFVCAMWAEASEFEFDEPRFEAAFAELEAAAYSGRSLALVVTPVEGLVIDSDEVALGDGLALVRGVALRDTPPELRGDEFATVAVLTLAGEGPSLEDAGRRLRRLQTALRLWDDAEPAIGPTAWARTDGGPWLAIPLATSVRRKTEDCLVAPEEEDPLRAFCALVTRRTPRSGELAWGLRRFELGCERGTPLEALTDWLLCARALLAEPDAGGYELLPERIAAICAVPDEREELVDRLRQAIAMERGVIAGIVRPEPGVDALVGSLGACLRAILRDVLCGHLDPDLRQLADGLLADVAPVAPQQG